MADYYINYYFVYFIITSFIGWIYETIFCTVKSKKWDNRGFLYGPVVPIYGTGSLLGTLIMTYVYVEHTPLGVFLISVVGSAILEFSAHYMLEKLFHAYWWDYSNMPLNIQGRICLPCSLAFGVGGLLVIYVINPYLLPFLDKASPLLMEILMIIFLIMMSSDTTVTVSVLSSFDKKIVNLDNTINNQMDKIVDNIVDTSRVISSSIEEARANVQDAHIENAIRSLSPLHNSVYRRIKGFRYDKNNIQMSSLREKFKKKIEEYKNK